MKKSILLIVLCIAIALTGLYGVAMAASPGNYTLTVSSGQNTVLTSINTNFASVLAGNNATINPTFNATNEGNVAANVGVQFVVNNSVYGFKGATSSISGTYVDMQHDALGWQALLAAPTDTVLNGTIAADNAPDNFGINVRVPAGQTAETYVATIQVTFS